MSRHPRYLPADERRAATVEAVVNLAAEQIPSDITTTAIAERMGLTQGALFRHFSSKDAILQTVMTWVTERLLARVDKAAKSVTSPIAALEAIFMTHIEFVTEHPGVPRMLFGELQRPSETLPKRMVQTVCFASATTIRKFFKRTGSNNYDSTESTHYLDACDFPDCHRLRPADHQRRRRCLVF